MLLLERRHSPRKRRHCVIVGPVICPSCRTENPGEGGLCQACGGPLRPVAPGTVLAGRYEILAVLGRGGMGTVYSARDRVIDETVALKVLRPEIADSPEFKRRFLTEVRLARRVTHPIVCRIHEYGEDGGLRFLVMELVHGQDLRRLLSAGPLLPERALEIAIQAAEGLQAIHAAGIVHRDLKTANLMVDEAGGIKLMDFGIAKPVAGGGKAAAPSGYIVGTPEYMSPEQGRGRPVDARSDIYSLGVVVYELFTGRVPFHADTPVATLMMHVDTPPPLDDPALPPAVADVLRRALAKDPGDRFPTAQAMADALRGERTLRLGRRSRGARREIVLAGIVLIVGAWAAWRWRPTTEPSAPIPSPVLVPPSSAAVMPSPVMLSPAVTASVAPSTPAPTRAPSTPSPRAPAQASSPPSREGPSPIPPTPAPVVIAPASPSPSPEATAPPTTIPRPAGLLVVVKPWADVSIDGVHRGQTPLARLEVTPGAHQVVLSHPDYQPWVRRVSVAAGETLQLDVDLRLEAVRRRR
jgi:serine/threonine protein kinase